jgi:uncharacterized protein YutE (UPF0331/DUF86 family)
MTFEATTVEQRLKKLREYVVRLEDIARTPKDTFVADYRQQWLAERGLQLCAEIVLDIANHILAAVYHRYPETNEEALDALRQSGVVTEAARAGLQGFGGLRNVLVHDYLAVDASQIYNHIQKAPPALHRFSREVLEWLERQSRSED